MIGILKAPILKGEDLAATPVQLLVNVSTVFKTTLAIALGAALGVAIIQTVNVVRGIAPRATTMRR